MMPNANCRSLSDRRWAPFKAALKEGLRDLKAGRTSMVTVLTHPGEPTELSASLGYTMIGEEIALIGPESTDFTDSLDEAVQLSMTALRHAGVERPDQVNAAFPRRVSACNSALAGPSSHVDVAAYDRRVLWRSVQRALIAQFEYSPHWDDDMDFVIDEFGFHFFVRVLTEVPIIRIWADFYVDDSTCLDISTIVNEFNQENCFGRVSIYANHLRTETAISCSHLSPLDLTIPLTVLMEETRQLYESISNSQPSSAADPGVRANRQ